MGRKMVPGADVDFLTKAETFARTILREPDRYGLTLADAQAMENVAKRFRETFQAARCGGQSRAATREKNEARVQTKVQYKRCIDRIRINESVDAQARFLVGLVQRTTRSKPRACPVEAPRLKFVRPHHEPGAMPVHELEFRAMDYLAGAKPEGAEKLELFVDLIPPEEPIPAHPGANHGGRPWYLRSYNRSPIKLIPPMTNVPMRVVYWGRWVDKQGNFGPFSATAVGWMEGGSHLPRLNPMKTLPKLMEDASASGPADRAVTYRVALIEAQIASINPQRMSGDSALPAPEEGEPRQLEGPEVKEAA